MAVLRNATIEAGSVITADGKGFGPGAGPGAGRSTNSIGSGAGYGGNGGASSKLPGGAAYGSAEQPVDRGSGGGLGWGTPTAGSEGGGAIRLSVGGTLMVNGALSAGGNAGMQDDAGGGSGGSIWLRAGALAGAGLSRPTAARESYTTAVVAAADASRSTPRLMCLAALSPPSAGRGCRRVRLAPSSMPSPHRLLR